MQVNYIAEVTWLMRTEGALRSKATVTISAQLMVRRLRYQPCYREINLHRTTYSEQHGAVVAAESARAPLVFPASSPFLEESTQFGSGPA